jgi:hypothetical protein
MDLNLNETTGIPSTYNYLNSGLVSGLMSNPSMIVILLIMVIVYGLIFTYLGKINITTQQSQALGKSPAVVFMEVLLWGTFLFLVLLNGVKYFFEIDIIASVKNVLSGKPQVTIDVNNVVPEEPVVPEIMEKKQVFHIPENIYSYEDADALCKAYGAELASYNEVESAYENGAEWCSYGWSKNQLALYPTQKKTYKKLQKIKGHEHDCGRPGINGGYIANKNVRFGVNCYGNKPEADAKDQEYMDKAKLIPISQKDIKLRERIDKFKRHLPSVLVAPFNKINWSSPGLF